MGTISLSCHAVSLVAFLKAPHAPNGNCLPELFKRNNFVKSWIVCDIDRVLKSTAFQKINRRKVEILNFNFKQFFIPFKIGALVVSLYFSVMFIYQGTIIMIILISSNGAYAK